MSKVSRFAALMIAVSPSSTVSFANADQAQRVTKIAVGNFHSCALLSNNTVKCWGHNNYASLGIGDNESRGFQPGQMGGSLPVLDFGYDRPIIDITIASFHGCVMFDDHKVKCWGWNRRGTFGLGNEGYIGNAPEQMGAALPFLDTGDEEIAQVFTAYTRVCLLFKNGNLKCAGDSSNSQLVVGDLDGSGGVGDTPSETWKSIPSTNLGNTAEILDFQGGATGACVLFADERVKCWQSAQPEDMGDNLPYLDFGNGRTAKQISVAGYMGCALLNDDSVRCWEMKTVSRPPVDTSAADIPLGEGLKPVRVETGFYHACVLFDDHRVKCVGKNSFGELGLGDTERRSGSNDLPFVDFGGLNTASIAAGWGHTCALFTNGGVKCWGRGGNGQLGQENNLNVGDDPGELQHLGFVSLWD